MGCILGEGHIIQTIGTSQSSICHQLPPGGSCQGTLSQLVPRGSGWTFGKGTEHPSLELLLGMPGAVLGWGGHRDGVTWGLGSPWPKSPQNMVRLYWSCFNKKYKKPKILRSKILLKVARNAPKIFPPSLPLKEKHWAGGPSSEKETTFHFMSMANFSWLKIVFLKGVFIPLTKKQHQSCFNVTCAILLLNFFGAAAEAEYSLFPQSLCNQALV